MRTAHHWQNGASVQEVVVLGFGLEPENAKLLHAMSLKHVTHSCVPIGPPGVFPPAMLLAVQEKQRKKGQEINILKKV